MRILDIHTHYDREGAIIDCRPSDFHPEKGKFYSMGIHPWHLSEGYMREWELLKEISSHSQVLAIGEAGLDKLATAEMQLQMEVFEWQINLSEQIGKPLIIHSVRTSNELILLKKRHKPSMPWIIHGFRGNKNVAFQLIEHGFYLSFGEKYQEEVLQNVPVNKILLETDESMKDIMQLYSSASSLLSLPTCRLIRQVEENIRQIFFNG